MVFTDSIHSCLDSDPAPIANLISQRALNFVPSPHPLGTPVKLKGWLAPVPLNSESKQPIPSAVQELRFLGTALGLTTEPPTATILQRNTTRTGCPCVSAGVENHAGTNEAARRAVFEFWKYCLYEEKQNPLHAQVKENESITREVLIEEDQQATWICQMCTLINTNLNDTICIICQSPR